MRRQVAVLALAAGLLSGCGSGVRFIRQDATKYPPKPHNARVEVFEDGTLEPHVVLGTLTAEKKMKASFNDRSFYDDAVTSLKKAAREIGADALVRMHPESVEGGLGGKMKVTATAIRFLQRATTISSEAGAAATP